jgi:hypothetical protein
MSSLKDKLISALPPFRNHSNRVVQRQGTEDIINYMCSNTGKYQTDYDKIYPYFDTGNIYDTCRKLWEFLKYNLVYTAETGEDQSVKSPSAILAPGQKTDCKHYSLFEAGVLDAIKENTGQNFDWCFRFVSDKSRINVSHVFVVVFDQDNEIWIDPCLTSFDQRKKYLLIDDVKPMPLYEISGVTDQVQNQVDPIIIVDKAIAFGSFLALLNMNFLGIKDLITANMDVTTDQVKDYMLENGLNYEQFLIFLQS